MGWFQEEKPLNTQLLEAIGRRDIVAVKHLLKEGADPNARSRSDYGYNWPVRRAVVADSPEIISVLATAGADLDKGDGCFTFFELALHDEKWAVLEKLFELSGKKAEDCFTVNHLFEAINREKYRTVKTLLNIGLDTNLRNKEGFTPRELAVKVGNPAIIGLFGPAAPLALPAPDTADAAPASDRWEMFSATQIFHVTESKALNEKITDRFNFATRERITTILDLEHKVQSAVIRSFDEMKDKTPLEQACDALEQNGVKIDRDIIHQPPRKKILLTGPEK